MHRKKQIALLFGMFAFGKDVDAIKTSAPQKMTYAGYETMRWDQVPDDTKALFKRSKLEVTGWLGWGCYEVKTVPDDYHYHDACVAERFIEHPDYNNLKVTEPYIYRYTP